jgi:hypothetical protein
MNITHEQSITQPTTDGTGIFAGFPYVVTQIVPALHHILLLPRTWELDQFMGLAERQVQLNKLPTCLVFREDLCVYFAEDGSGMISDSPPRGVRIVSGQLAPAEPIPDSAELSVRQMELVLLEESINTGPGTTILFGDLTKGGREPTPDEELTLKGTHAEGVPRGLLPCLSCGEWRGECFDTLNTGLLVRIHCTCENDNHCARCGELLGERKLNANYFDPVDRTVWHVPGFLALEHKCPGEHGEGAGHHVDEEGRESPFVVSTLAHARPVTTH